MSAPLSPNCRTIQKCDLLPEIVFFSPSLLHDDNSFNTLSAQSNLVAGMDESTYGWASQEVLKHAISLFCSCSALLSSITQAHLNIF